MPEPVTTKTRSPFGSEYTSPDRLGETRTVVCDVVAVAPPPSTRWRISPIGWRTRASKGGKFKTLPLMVPISAGLVSEV